MTTTVKRQAQPHPVSATRTKQAQAVKKALSYLHQLEFSDRQHVSIDLSHEGLMDNDIAPLINRLNQLSTAWTVYGRKTLSLNLSHNALSDTSLSQLALAARRGRVTQLNLSHNVIVGDHLPANFHALISTRLHTLDLSSNPVKDNAARALLNTPKLKATVKFAKDDFSKPYADLLADKQKMNGAKVKNVAISREAGTTSGFVVGYVVGMITFLSLISSAPLTALILGALIVSGATYAGYRIAEHLAVKENVKLESDFTAKMRLTLSQLDNAPRPGHHRGHGHASTRVTANKAARAVPAYPVPNPASAKGQSTAVHYDDSMFDDFRAKRGAEATPAPVVGVDSTQSTQTSAGFGARGQ